MRKTFLLAGILSVLVLGIAAEKSGNKWKRSCCNRKEGRKYCGSGGNEFY